MSPLCAAHSFFSSHLLHNRILISAGKCVLLLWQPVIFTIQAEADFGRALIGTFVDISARVFTYHILSVTVSMKHSNKRSSQFRMKDRMFCVQVACNSSTLLRSIYNSAVLTKIVRGRKKNYPHPELITLGSACCIKQTLTIHAEVLRARGRPG